MINNLKFFIQIILLTPLIFLILILSPIFRVRIGKIKSNLIGHMTTPMEIFIGEKKRLFCGIYRMVKSLINFYINR